MRNLPIFVLLRISGYDRAEPRAVRKRRALTSITTPLTTFNPAALIDPVGISPRSLQWI